MLKNLRRTVFLVCGISLTQAFEDRVFGSREKRLYEFGCECPWTSYHECFDSTQWNNFGPPRNFREKLQPFLRDWDGDGVYNHLDFDDDNDGITDEYDPNPWSWTRPRY